MQPNLENTESVAGLCSGLNARFHNVLIRFFLRRTRDRSDAEDLTQEVLLRALRAARVGKIERAQSYIFKIAVNLLRDGRRDAPLAGAAVFVPIQDMQATELEDQLREDLSPERVLASRDSLIEALRTLGELGDRTRDIFILSRVENMRQKDIAALYGIGQSTVEKHVMKAALHLATRCGRSTDA